MPLLVLALLIAGGIALGLGATWSVIARGISFDQQHKGIWLFVPRAGAPDMDPYRRARVFVEGELPLAAGEGFALRATLDSEGQALDGQCQYRLAGPMPAARFWTLTLTTPDGDLITHPTQRAGFTSSELVRFQDGASVIMIGADPLAGNWLPAPREGRFTLMLRLYETPLSATATILGADQVPRIDRIRCRS